MKKFKTAAALGVAAIMTAGLLSTAAFAEDTNRVYVKADQGSVNDTVSVSIVIDSDTYQLQAFAFTVNYDKESLELQGEPIVNDIYKNGFSNVGEEEKGKILAVFAGVDEGAYFHDREIIKLSFKVLKANGEITIDVDELNEFNEDGTDVSGSFIIENGIVKCSHKNTETNTTPATCKDSGKKETVCKDCGTVVKTETIPATGEHDWKEEVIKPATCTEKGSKTLTCKVCGETKAEEIPELGHNWDKGSITTEPTCTEKGVKTFTCTKCHETKTENVPANGHDWGEWKVTKEATTEAEGEETRECKICGEKETKAIAKLPSENITTSYSGGGFSVPETTASTAAPAESETVTSAAATQTDAVTQASETTANVTAAVTADPATDNTSADIQDNIGIGNADSENSIGNTGVGNANDKNIPTGMALAVIPAAAAAVGVVIFKKRK